MALEDMNIIYWLFVVKPMYLSCWCAKCIRVINRAEINLLTENKTSINVYNFYRLCNTVTRIFYEKHFITITIYANRLNTVMFIAGHALLFVCSKLKYYSLVNKTSKNTFNRTNR